MQWGAGHGDQRGQAGPYLCPEGCRPTHSQRSSICAPQGSPGHRCSGWGRQQLSSEHASKGRTQVWLEGRLRFCHAPSLAPLPTAPLKCDGGCRPLGLPQGTLSLARGSPAHLTHLAQRAHSGCSSRGCSTSPRTGMWCRCSILSHSLAQWHSQHGGSSLGSLQKKMLHAAVSQGAGLAPGAPTQAPAHTPPIADPHAGIPWSEQQYLWWAGGRSRPSQSGSTSQHQGSHGQRGSTIWGAKGLCSPLPGTHPL